MVRRRWEVVVAHFPDVAIRLRRLSTNLNDTGTPAIVARDVDQTAASSRLEYCPQQAHRKERRDQIEESRRFRLIECQYSFGGQHLIQWEKDAANWEAEQRPQVVTTRIFSIPRSALTLGLARRPLLVDLLTRAFGALAPCGLPLTPSPRGAWILEVELDATTHTAQAILKPWNGGEYAVAQRIEVGV